MNPACRNTQLMTEYIRQRHRHSQTREASGTNNTGNVSKILIRTSGFLQDGFDLRN